MLGEIVFLGKTRISGGFLICSSRALTYAAICFCFGDASFGAEQSLEKQVRDLFENHCSKCHGKNVQKEGLNVLNYPGLVDKTDKTGKKNYVVPRDLNSSLLWKRVGIIKDMPEEGKLSDKEIALIRSWIEQGAAPFPADAPIKRKFVDTTSVLKEIRADLEKRNESIQPFLRYFSFQNLHNNPDITEQDLCLARAALSKAINSLSWERDIIVPEAVDADKVLFRINLTRLRWHNKNNVWNALGAQYPYGLRYDQQDDDKSLKENAKKVYELTDTTLPVIRGDWFISIATQPPLYHRILMLPDNAKELEEKLGVDVVDDFHFDRLRRAAFNNVSVSRNNRLLDRHASSYGYYWKSYDFKSSFEKENRNCIRKPLGPKFNGNGFALYAFEHDGGEIIFSLPNAMQGYLIVNKVGNRINTAPDDIVTDNKRANGESKVVNGLSCIVCHKDGMNVFKDMVRGSKGLRGEPQAKVERLFASDEEIRRLLADDQKQFLAALKKATGEFLSTQADREPIGSVSVRYFEDLRLEDVLAELGLNPTKPEEWRAKFDSRDFESLGLRAVVTGGARIKRSSWEKPIRAEERDSQFQEIAEKVGLGGSR